MKIILERMVIFMKTVPGCPKLGNCIKNCHDCDYGQAFLKMWKIIFSERDKIKKLRHENELLKHPEARRLSTKDWPKMSKPLAGTQAELCFIDESISLTDEQKKMLESKAHF